MTELDFDELDKAVNSLMAEGGKSTTSVAQSMPASSTEPVATQVTPTTPVSASPTAVTPPSPAVRRRGQFMDVIRPGAARTAPSPATRQGVDVTPPQTDLTTLSENTPAPVPSSEPQPVDDGLSETGENESSISPDSNTTSPLAAPDPALEITQDVPQPTAQDNMRGNQVEEDEDPQLSPFLPDAKVEKRPLGGAAPFDTPEETSDSHEAHEDVVDMPVTDTPTEPEMAPTPLPDELQQDVVEVEANEVLHDEEPVDEPAQTPALPEASATPESSATEATPVSGSINQQYQEQPSTGDQTNGAIFDTNTYHQPLEAQAHKKKSSTLAWVLWIVVLLIVGATAGAAWFYFTTQ